jgi:bifunctional DNA-binding transcriptional regulator/antitoxin component of YhaV-PrlF toxin-antitoxin module
MGTMNEFTLKLDKQGRVMLPSSWRREAGVHSSAILRAVVTDEGALRLETPEQGLRRARSLVRKYIPEGINLSDELIADRRREAAREDARR